MKEYIGKPEDKLTNLMDPANPIMSGRGAEPRLVHEGQDRPALVLRSRRPALREAFDVFAEQDRPAL